jgi:hypothetical protein
VSERVLWLEGRVRHLSAQNAELEWTVRALVDLLVDRGVVGLDELARLMQAGVTSPVPFEDEPAAPPEWPPDQPEAMPSSDQMPLSDEPDLEAAAMRELQRAAQQRRAAEQQSDQPGE